MSIWNSDLYLLRARLFGTTPELEYSEYMVFLFFWENCHLLFRFQAEACRSILFEIENSMYSVIPKPE